MSELKFYCPGCNQKIQCDEQWGGHTIQCPACQVAIIVPQSETAPAPAPSAPAAAPGGYSPGRTHPQSRHVPPSASAPVPSRTPARSQSSRREKSKRTGQIVKYAVILAVIGAGAFFGIKFAGNWQRDLNEKSAKATKESDGGQVGHIANLYEMLDATDPNRYSRYGSGTSSRDVDDEPLRIGRRSRGGAGTTPEKPLPVIPAVWTLDLASGKIPEGRANGKIGGTNFLVESARIERTPQAWVLTLRQGAGVNADREILIYLKLNAGESPMGHSWNITKDLMGTKAPQVLKRWKTNPKFAPTQKIFGGGYAMKLELGKLDEEEETIPGKIFISLPDNEQSVIAGLFTAQLAMVRAEPTMLQGGDDF